MTRFICVTVVLLFSAAAAAAAVPTAQYNPTTGNITFVGVGFGGHLVIESASGAIIKDFAGGVGFDPTIQVTFQDYYVNYAGFFTPQLPGRNFPDPFNAGKVVTPGTSASDLLLNYRVGDNLNPYLRGNISVIPEPSTIALTSVALLSLAALRRRINPATCERTGGP